MKAFAGSILVVLTFACASSAGEIHGSVTEQEKPVGPGVKLEVKCAKGSYSAQTGEYGSYRLYLPEQGKCTLTAHFRQQTPSIDIFSSDEAARYDLVLESKSGQYSLRRK